MGSQQQPITVDTLSTSPQTGVWVAGATVSTPAGTPQSWKNGDIVYALVTNASNLTVTGVASGGVGLGAFALVTDGTTQAKATNATTLEAELWAATATADGSGVITATMSGTGAAGTGITSFALLGTQAGADKVVVANANAAIVALPAATSNFGDAQALTIEVVANSNNTPAAQTAYSLVGNSTLTGTVKASVTLANAYTAVAATVVTPPVSLLTQSSGAPSVAMTILLKPPIPPPTALTAVYTAGVGISLAWTPPAGYTGTGYNVYKQTNASTNGVPQKLDIAAPTTPIPWGTNAFVDRMQGFNPVQSGDNVCTYYVTTVNGNNEGPASNIAVATWLG